MLSAGTGGSPMATRQLWSTAFASAGPSAALIYENIMVPRLFGPWARLLLDEVGLASADALLDVACGPGTVARQAAAQVGPGGRVTGCDLSRAMLTVARSNPRGEASAPVEYLECPADALAVPDAAYDVVTCQHGLQFVSDRERALREMHRALRPRGRLGVATWCSIDECPPFAALATALAEVCGQQTAAAYRSGPWGMADDDLAALAERAGFTDIQVSRHQLPVLFEGGLGQLLQTLATTGVATAVAELGAAGQRALATATGEAAAPLLTDGAVRSMMAARLMIASA